MSAWIDITRPVDGQLLCWPGRTPPRHTWEKRIADGAHCNVSVWELNAHTGTHIDAPLHFVDGGRSIDLIPPDVLIGECAIIDARESGAATPLGTAEIEACCGQARILVRTGHSDIRPGGAYAQHGPLLTPEAAGLLLEGGLQLIGTDRLSVDGSDGQDFTLHHQLLGAGCVIVEGLALASVSSGIYTLCVLPLLLAGAEASPARALLAGKSTAANAKNSRCGRIG